MICGSLWQINTTVLARDGVCVVVDPAYFPRELDAIASEVRGLGRAEALVFTHSHWDHVMGHAKFPGVRVWVSRALHESVASRAAHIARDLDEAREFDSRHYVARPGGYEWPEDLGSLDDGEGVELGGIVMRALHLPGHTPDGLGLLIEEQGLLLAGDYLSACEIPFVDDARAYRATLARLIDLLASSARDVIPGHGPRLGADEALAIARADLDYLDALIAMAGRGDAKAALDLSLPRAAGVVGMREHHRDNCARAGLIVP